MSQPLRAVPRVPATTRREDHRAENLDRLRRGEAGDMSNACYWCGETYVNTGDFPYCSKPCAIAAEQDG